MSNLHDALYKDAIDAINHLFFDQSVSVEETKNSLETLKEELDVLIDTIDIKEE